jgi:hypothetical protein
VFKVECILADKFGNRGEVVRLKRFMTNYLNTEKGVMNFINEMKPFVSITITDETKKDWTTYFLGE